MSGGKEAKFAVDGGACPAWGEGIGAAISEAAHLMDLCEED